MFAGTLLGNIDTTTHDVYALLLMQQKVYGSWSLPKNASPAMRVLEDTRYDHGLWKNLPYDPDVQRTLEDYSTVVDYDKREDEDFMNILTCSITWTIWDAHCSYRERATRIMKDFANLSPERVDQALVFLSLSERFRNIHAKINQSVEFKKVQELESLIRSGTGMFVWELREHVKIQQEKLEAAIEFTRYS